jgi:hypothetical protein
MQKVVGSSPISRFVEQPANEPFLLRRCAGAFRGSFGILAMLAGGDTAAQRVGLEVACGKCGPTDGASRAAHAPCGGALSSAHALGYDGRLVYGPWRRDRHRAGNLSSGPKHAQC